MMFARADSYINVYLPREDGTDPRRYAQVDSPVFEEDTVYRFSDEIVKDRKLFLGRKHPSLYEIYYKDGKESSALPPPSEENTGTSDSDGYARDEEGDEGESAGFHTHYRQHGRELIHLPKVNKVSLSLDRMLRRSRRHSITRFNEPVPYTGTNKLRNQPVSLDRQNTSYDLTRKQTAKTITRGVARNQNLSRMFKKAQSAPSTDLRQVRILGLPPISRSHTTVTGMSTEVTEASNADTSQTRTLPLRPSSKPNKIWRQTSHLVGQSAGSNISGRRIHTGSSRFTVGSMNGIIWT